MRRRRRSRLSGGVTASSDGRGADIAIIAALGSFGDGIGGAGAHGRSGSRLGDAAVGRERFAAGKPGVSMPLESRKLIFPNANLRDGLAKRRNLSSEYENACNLTAFNPCSRAEVLQSSQSHAINAISVELLSRPLFFFAEAFVVNRKKARGVPCRGRRQTSALTPHLSPAPRRPA